jgi:hypothetical protein
MVSNYWVREARIRVASPRGQRRDESRNATSTSDASNHHLGDFDPRQSSEFAAAVKRVLGAAGLPATTRRSRDLPGHSCL